MCLVVICPFLFELSVFVQKSFTICTIVDVAELIWNLRQFGSDKLLEKLFKLHHVIDMNWLVRDTT